MHNQDTIISNTPQDSQLTNNPLYLQRTERAKADKPPSQGTPLGVVAASRFPNSKSRKEMAEGIQALGACAVETEYGIIHI